MQSTRRLALLSFLLAAAGCKDDDEKTYTQFNAETDVLDIEVGTEKVTPSVLIQLHSSTGEVTVGTAEVDPGGGPVGTEHEIVVVVEDAYQDIVDRVSVRTDTPDRGEDEYDLEADSADEGYYKTTLVSVGTVGEVRTDTLTIRLWDEDDDEDSGGKDTDTGDLDDTGDTDDSGDTSDSGDT